MTQNQTKKDQIKRSILETIRTEKPATTKHLVNLIQEQTTLPKDEITKILLELENENSLHFIKQEFPTPQSTRKYLFSEKATWYWTIITVAIATSIAVFTIPEDSYPVVYLRIILGTIFVLFLPGFTLIKALFPTKAPIQLSSENMDSVERIALGLGTSLALTPLVALVLNYTPWGIRLTPLTLSLLALTLVFASVAILREHQAKITLPPQG
jgi:putative Mn2+ efflux pump MntP